MAGERVGVTHEHGGLLRRLPVDPDRLNLLDMVLIIDRHAPDVRGIRHDRQKFDPLEGVIRRASGEFRGLVKNVSRSEEHTSELKSIRRSSDAVFCLKKQKIKYVKE